MLSWRKHEQCGVLNGAVCQRDEYEPFQSPLKLKAITGKSAIDFIHKIRFNRACQLLKEGKYTVSEISFMVGYNTPSYFPPVSRSISVVFLRSMENSDVCIIMEYYYEDVFFLPFF